MKKEQCLLRFILSVRTSLPTKLLFLLILFSHPAQSQGLAIITSTVAKKGENSFAHSLEEIHKGDRWGWHSGKIGKATATSTLGSSKVAGYGVKNLHDLDLATAWIEGASGYGARQSFSFVLSAEEPFNYKNFNGVIEIFNGYCKSESIWKANSRVKKLKMYYEDIPVCLVELADTWQYQSFDIGHFFKSYRYPDAPFQLSNGSSLKFEIIEVYPGEKYKDVAVSEFVTPSYGGG
ncbi:NADase-type glycan-binding domain-containing protein [Nafulsella turpanensis]|uniref:NADase-type glycan-binding domain-containing protein n=1 Tax=Nafulsella turpanensis TaxID=1265690 RepID=UPI00035C9603|nr:hypothetical protein [Nafulsella turpanensis]